MKTHSSRLFDKLNAKRRTQAVQIGKQFGLIPYKEQKAYIFHISFDISHLPLKKLIYARSHLMPHSKRNNSEIQKVTTGSQLKSRLISDHLPPIKRVS